MPDKAQALTTLSFEFDDHVFNVECTNTLEPLFSLNELCDYLGYKDPNRAAKRHLEPEDLSYAIMPTTHGDQRMRVVSETGMYCLLLGSKLPRAKAFRRKVAGEILPSIGRTGQYQTKAYRLEFEKGQVTQIVNELMTNIMTTDTAARIEVERVLMARFDKVFNVPEQVAAGHDADFTIAREFALGKVRK